VKLRTDVEGHFVEVETKLLHTFDWARVSSSSSAAAASAPLDNEVKSAQSSSSFKSFGNVERYKQTVLLAKQSSREREINNPK